VLGARTVRGARPRGGARGAGPRAGAAGRLAPGAARGRPAPPGAGSGSRGTRWDAMTLFVFFLPSVLTRYSGLRASYGVSEHGRESLNAEALGPRPSGAVATRVHPTCTRPDRACHTRTARHANYRRRARYERAARHALGRWKREGDGGPRAVWRGEWQRGCGSRPPRRLRRASTWRRRGRKP